jgi:hypothetical protein
MTKPTLCVKREVLDLISALPDECSYDEIRFRLYLHRKWRESEKAIAEGRVHTQDEVERITQTWFPSSGMTPPSTT